MYRAAWLAGALAAGGCWLGAQTAERQEAPMTQAPPDSTSCAAYEYRWPEQDAAGCIASRIAPPEGYRRMPLAAGGFGDWLRHLPLAPEGTPVQYHNGQAKPQQYFHEAVVAIDVGKKDLQQCADAVMRLRAEYLYAAGQAGQISFRFTNGDPAPFREWMGGKRISIQNNRLAWVPDPRSDGSWPSFRRYLDAVFTYAGTASLSKELDPVALDSLVPGDVLIQGGFPGHAVLVADAAEHPQTGDRAWLLLQSYMPAQSVHVLKHAGGAWFSRDDWRRRGEAITPQWAFRLSDGKRFRPAGSR